MFLTMFLVGSLQGTYTLARAQQSFRSLVHIHEKNGKYRVKIWLLLMHHIKLLFKLYFQAGSHLHRRTDKRGASSIIQLPPFPTPPLPFAGI